MGEINLTPVLGVGECGRHRDFSHRTKEKNMVYCPKKGNKSPHIKNQFGQSYLPLGRFVQAPYKIHLFPSIHFRISLMFYTIIGNILEYWDTCRDKADTSWKN